MVDGRYWEGDNETALGYFQSALKEDPNYQYGTAYQQGLLSYVGRTEYLTGRLPQARETLKRHLPQKRRRISPVFILA